MKKTITIIGGGPAALMLAAQLDEQKFDITIYERNAAMGRKFLVAGDGGFNLTHSEEISSFIARYTPSDFFQNIISGFSNTDLRKWLTSIGIDTFVGSSKRVFPVEGIKPIDVLNAILKVLKQKNIRIKTQHTWKGWKENQLIFETTTETIEIQSDIVVFSLGGASWEVTGSDGNWTSYFSEKGIEVIPFRASNCAYHIQWEREFIKTAEGQSLKNISLKCGDKEKKGEVVITSFGLEGGAIYALSPAIRKQFDIHRSAIVYLDLKPQMSSAEIKNKMINRGNKSLSKQLADELNINSLQLNLLKNLLSKEEFTDPSLLSEKIKNIPLTIIAAAPIDEAISTVGGIALTEIDERFQLKKLPNSYVIGEMIDWDAPTGGYLLQACFSMGYYLGKELNKSFL